MFSKITTRPRSIKQQHLPVPTVVTRWEAGTVLGNSGYAPPRPWWRVLVATATLLPQGRRGPSGAAWGRLHKRQRGGEGKTEPAERHLGPGPPGAAEGRLGPSGAAYVSGRDGEVPGGQVNGRWDGRPGGPHGIVG
jgi:hypothetical protein